MRRECDENKQTHQQREWALHVWVIGNCFIVSRIWNRLFHYSRQFCWLLACIKSNSNPWETLNIVCAHLWLRLRLAFTLTDAYFDFLVAVRAATPLKHWVVLLYFVLHVFNNWKRQNKMLMVSSWTSVNQLINSENVWLICDSDLYFFLFWCEYSYMCIKYIWLPAITGCHCQTP